MPGFVGRGLGMAVFSFLCSVLSLVRPLFPNERPRGEKVTIWP